MFEPDVSGWIVPLVLVVVLATVISLLGTLPSTDSPLAGAGYICASGLFGVCLLWALAKFLQWYAFVKIQAEQARADARATTPLLRAAQSVRQLTPEQAALLPRFMPDDAQIAFVDTGKELVAHFYTEEGLIPWDFIESFLLASNAVYLMNINSTSDKTPERVYAQAMTNVCIRKGWATPALGPHPAMWKPGGRDAAAKFFQIKLRNGTGYVEPEPEDEDQESDE